MKESKTLAHIIFSFVILPLFVALLALGEGAISSNVMMIIASAAHIFMFFITASMILLKNGKNRENYPKTFSNTSSKFETILIFSLVLIPLLSILYNISFANANIFHILRTLLVVVYTINIFVLYPKFVRKLSNKQSYMYVLLNGYTFITIVLIVYSFYVFSTGQSPYSRLGYPLIPGVFAYYLMIGLVIELFTRQRKFISLLYFVGIVFSGSRSAILIVIMVFLFFSFWNFRKNFLRVVFLGGVFCIIMLVIYINYNEVLQPYLMERDNNILSGRTEIWEILINDLRQSDTFLVGTSHSPEVEILDQKFGAHNSFLDLALTYGVPYAFLAIVAWVYYFGPREIIYRKKCVNRIEFQIGILKIVFFLIVTIKSLIVDVFWTNMGDPATLFILFLLLLPLNFNTKKGLHS